MKPTMKLRWRPVKKGQVVSGDHAPGDNLVLEQWWEETDLKYAQLPGGEWREVPLETD